MRFVEEPDEQGRYSLPQGGIGLDVLDLIAQRFTDRAGGPLRLTNQQARRLLWALADVEAGAARSPVA